LTGQWVEGEGNTGSQKNDKKGGRKITKVGGGTNKAAKRATPKFPPKWEKLLMRGWGLQKGNH